MFHLKSEKQASEWIGKNRKWKKICIFLGYRKTDDIFNKNAKNINTQAEIISKFQLYGKTIKISFFL